MKRYIEVNALMEYCSNQKSKTISNNDIARFPTADVVEVVRCKDCRHADECHKSVQYTRNEPNSVTIGYSQIEWCSKGERKEESEVKE